MAVVAVTVAPGATVCGVPWWCWRGGRLRSRWVGAKGVPGSPNAGFAHLRAPRPDTKRGTCCVASYDPTRPARLACPCQILNWLRHAGWHVGAAAATHVSAYCWVHGGLPGRGDICGGPEQRVRRLLHAVLPLTTDTRRTPVVCAMHGGRKAGRPMGLPDSSARWRVARHACCTWLVANWHFPSVLTTCH